MTKNKENTKKLIIESAIKLFSSTGYNAATTAQIAKEAGVSEAVIFKYFKNKANLLKEISLIAMNSIAENISIIPFLKNIEISKNYPLKEFIKSIIMERLELFDKNYELSKILLIEMQYSEELRKQTRLLVRPKVVKIVDSVKKIIIDKGNFSEVRAKAIIRIMAGVIQSFFIQRYMLNADISEKDIEIQIDEILNIIQKGCT